jgi:hypothetical protein
LEIAVEIADRPSAKVVFNDLAGGTVPHGSAA